MILPVCDIGDTTCAGNPGYFVNDPNGGASGGGGVGQPLQDLLAAQNKQIAAILITATTATATPSLLQKYPYEIAAIAGIILILLLKD